MNNLIFWPAFVIINGKEHVMAHYFTEREILEKLNAYQMAGHDEVFYHFAMGIISKFSICCIDFFCNTWENAFFDDLKDNYEFTFKKDEQVRCPDCIVKKLTKTQ